MSNGTATQSEGRLKFKPRTSSLENHPDAPEGGWKFLIPKGKVKVSTTQVRGDKGGDPQVVIPHKLTHAYDEKNESFQGTEVVQRIIFFDESTGEGKRNSNMQRDRLRQLCDAVDVEFADVYPTEIKDEHSFDKLIRALEGKTGDCWTVHRERIMDGGEKVMNTNVAYREPGKGLTAASVEDENDERPGRKAGKGKSRR